MSLLLAPYTHAMRLGQGFNSYTQQICLDDAVVIGEKQPENIVANDGTTMSAMAQRNAIPTAWTRQKELITASQPSAVLMDSAEKAKVEVASTAGDTVKKDETVTASKIAGKISPGTFKEPQGSKSNGHATDADEAHGKVGAPTEKEGAINGPKPDTSELATFKTETATRLTNLGKIPVERFNGMPEQTQKYEFDPTAPRGQSQTVTYTSRFVDRLSDVMDEMSVSGFLSIKAGKVGGSGKGSFVDSDKFKESDLNFYISVKVVNQTINLKDASVFNPLRSESKAGAPLVDVNNFRQVYGDSYISGFLEGGEFNALVSMKILDKAKIKDIQAAATIALTVGALPVGVEGEADVGITRAHIDASTETTIQVSWSGGGHIKPMEQQWDIQSLMTAASRFPDLVADCPQRTYAILTKYDALRSFVASKPASYTPIQYENAQIYTNTLLDAFVSYKSLYKRVGEHIFGIQGKTLVLIPWSDEDSKKVANDPGARSVAGSKDTPNNEKFEASLNGLSDARIAIRRQLARIVNEVDLIENDPKLATDETHAEPYQSPVSFEMRLPTVDVPENLRPRTGPSSGRGIAAKPLTEEEQKEAAAEAVESLSSKPSQLDENEKATFISIGQVNPQLGAYFKVSGAVGDNLGDTKSFNNLEFLKSDWKVRSIHTDTIDGSLCYLAVKYDNGLLVEMGTPASQNRASVKTFGRFAPGERVTSASIEYGRRKPKDIKETMRTQILGLRFHTNRGRNLIATARESKLGTGRTVIRDNTEYEDVKVSFFDVPFNTGSIAGFFGRGDDGAQGKIYRLGIIWCKLPGTEEGGTEFDLNEIADTVNSTGNASSPYEAQCGSFKATSKGWKPGKNSIMDVDVQYPRAYPSPPKLLYGLSIIDVEKQQNRCLSLRHREARADGFKVKVSAFDDCRGHEIGCNWLTLPNDMHLETGMVSVQSAGQSVSNQSNISQSGSSHSDSGRSGSSAFEQQIWFSSAFDSPPNIVIWIQEFDWKQTESITIKCVSEQVSKNSFFLNIYSRANRRWEGVRVQWLAYPAEEDGKRVKTGTSKVERAQSERKLDEQFYGQPFRNPPKTFIALSDIDFGYNNDLRFYSEVSASTIDKLSGSFGTRGDTDMEHAVVQWIAIE